MKTKLSLNIDKSILESAKLYAKTTGQSLADLVENYLSIFSHHAETAELSPKLKKIVGAISLSAEFDEKEELRSTLERKHFK